MRIRMVVQMSGHRADGSAWPGPGNEFDTSDEEAVALIHAGIAVPVPVPEKRAAETRPAPADPAAETRLHDDGGGFFEEAAPAPPVSPRRSPGPARKG